jgi:hypothetical protein
MIVLKTVVMHSNDFLRKRIGMTVKKFLARV